MGREANNNTAFAFSLSSPQLWQQLKHNPSEIAHGFLQALIFLYLSLFIYLFWPFLYLSSKLYKYHLQIST